MVKETLTYVDYNGVEKTEDFYFNYTEAELTEMEFSVEGGFREMLERIIKSKDLMGLMREYKNIILSSYGEKSLDGRHFIKVKDGHRLAEDFCQTEAYSQLFTKFMNEPDAFATFVNGLIPQSMRANAPTGPVEVK